MSDASKLIRIAGRDFSITGDPGYLAAMGDNFEPSIVSLYSAMTSANDRVLDVGANIGLTACAFSTLCPDGRIACVEPVPRTYRYLQQNTSNLKNVSLFQHALGSAPGELRMQGNPDFLAGSFVADAYNIPDEGHFVERVPVKTLDSAFSSFGLDRLDFMKVDVEGFELEVFEGGRDILNEYKPDVFLEMNHWCLNVFRRISIPEFRDRLMSVFPFVFAVEHDSFIDFGDERNAHHIFHEHLIRLKYCNLVAGFNRDDLIARLSSVEAPAVPAQIAEIPPVEIHETHNEADDLRIEIRRLVQEKEDLQADNAALRNSTSWKVTAPLRAVICAVRK